MTIPEKMQAARDKLKAGRDKNAVSQAWNALTDGMEEIRRLSGENAKLRAIIREKLGTRSDYRQTMQKAGVSE
jgi:hypothetical protein